MSGINEPKIVEAMKMGLAKMLRLRKDPKSPVITIPPMMWLGAVIDFVFFLLAFVAFGDLLFHSKKSKQNSCQKKA